MIDIFEADLYSLELYIIINNNRKTIAIGDDLLHLTKLYEKFVEKYSNTEDHVIIALYDFDKNTNINYYDSELD